MKKAERIAKKRKNRDLRERRIACVRLCGLAGLPVSSIVYKHLLQWDPFKMKDSKVRCTHQPKTEMEVIDIARMEMVKRGVPQDTIQEILDKLRKILNGLRLNLGDRSVWDRRLMWVYGSKRKKKGIPKGMSMLLAGYGPISIIARLGLAAADLQRSAIPAP